MDSNSTSLNNISEKVLSFLKSNPEGVTQEKLTSAIPFNEELILECLNALNNSNRISILELSEGMVFKYVSEKDALKIRELTKDEMATYEIIMQSGSNGITIFDLKQKLKIEKTQYINKILTKLSKKFLIKSLKVLNTRNKKIWIGFDVVPSQEITGDIWCNDQKIDNDLVTVFCEKCNKYIEDQKEVSRKEILFFAKSINLSQKFIDIKEENIQKILNILVFDGKIEPIFPINLDVKFLGNKYGLLLDKGHPQLDSIKYKKIREYNNNNIYKYLPCVACPSFNECKNNNVINPVECIYIKELFNNND